MAAVVLGVGLLLFAASLFIAPAEPA